MSATLQIPPPPPLNWKLEIKTSIKKDSVKTYTKIQFAGPRQTFCFRLTICKKSLGFTVHYFVQIDRKYIIFCTQFTAQNAGNCILGYWNFEIFKGCTPPDPSRRTGVKTSFWHSQLLFSNLLATSIFIETLNKHLVSP